ncbi:substrate-binding domain-containing protein [Vibrio profundum]|uniref:substrate-binding domain-containing protein n=1 Tax=Vibrio profundum TaxID=2910247 RepID=UPI003D0B90DB
MKIGKGIFVCCLMTLPCSSFADKLRLALVPKEINNPFFLKTGEGCKAAAQELVNVECIFLGSKNIDVRKQDQVIEKLINEGVDGLAIAVTQSEFLAINSVKKAIEQGIPVITYDADFSPRDLQKNPSLRSAYIGTDDFEIGKALGEQLKHFHPDGGTLVIQSGRPDSPNLNLRVMGVRSALSGNNNREQLSERLKGQNGWKEFRDPMYNFGQFPRALRDMQTVLDIHKSKGIDSFVAVGGWPQFIDGYRELLQPYQLQLASKEMVVVIADTADVQLEYLKEKLAHGNVGQNPFEMGRQAIFLLYKIVKKQPYNEINHIPMTYCNQLNYQTCVAKRP